MRKGRGGERKKELTQRERQREEKGTRATIEPTKDDPSQTFFLIISQLVTIHETLMWERRDVDESDERKRRRKKERRAEKVKCTHFQRRAEEASPHSEIPRDFLA